MKYLISGFILIFSLFPLSGQKKPARIITNPGNPELKELYTLNSQYRETNLSITPDGRYLFFLSLRGEMPWSEKDYSIFRGQSQYDGDIWYSKKSGGEWQPPDCLPATINSANAEDEPNIFPDGNRVLFQSWRDSWVDDGGPYYISDLTGELWGKPAGLKGGINQYFKQKFREHEGYATDGAAVSPNGNLFLVAVAPDYDQPMDVYRSVKQENEIWSYLKNTTLSTPGDERSIFIAGDNRTVYFASDGYEGFGGLDIYKTTINTDGSFGEILNIGKPFNSDADDYGFIVTADGNEAYFVRDGDIFYADITTSSSEIKPLPVMLISGIVTDIYGLPVETNVKLVEVSKGETKGTAKSNAVTGEYLISFNRLAGRYRQEFSTDGYRTSIKEFNIDTLDSRSVIRNDMRMIDSDLVVVQFDFDQDSLKRQYHKSLDSLSLEIRRNKDLRLLISGHTDEKGSEEYNQELSKNRALQVAKYLFDSGIPRKSMRLKAHGEKKPKMVVGPLKDEINRRVEIRVVKSR